MACYPFEMFINQEVISDLQCQICKGVMKDPVVDECLHIFGRSCFTKFVTANRCCPLDKNSIPDISKISECVPFNGMISKLVVRCQNSSECNWTGKLSELSEHSEMNCLEKQTTCVNNLCSFSTRKRYLQKHYLECPFRVVSCESCSARIIFSNLSEHDKECGGCFITCTQNCSKRIRRDNLEKHLEEECTEVQKSCPNSFVGCQFLGKRDSINHHLSSDEGKAKHLLLLMNKFKSWESESKIHFNQINNRISKIESSLNTIKEKFNGNCQHILGKIQTEIGKSQTIMKRLLQRNGKFSSEFQESALKLISYQPSTPIATFEGESKKILENLKQIELSSNTDKKNMDDIFEILGTRPGHKNGLDAFIRNGLEGLSFDPKAKSSFIHLLSSKRVINKGSNGLALLSDPLIADMKYKFEIIKRESILMGVGICHKSTVQLNNFKCNGLDDHGCYMFYANGYKLSNRDGMIVDDTGKEFFKTGDEISLLFDSCQGRIHLEGQNRFFSSELPIESNIKIEDFYVCVFLSKEGESICII
jgi:hypothetical protein